MSTSYLVRRLTSLSLTLAILLNCFASSIYPSGLPSATDQNRAARRHEGVAKVVSSAPPAFNQWSLNSTGVPANFVDPTPTLDSKIAFTSERDGNQEIYIMDPDGSQQTRLTNNTASDADPAWSPDGTKIAFVSDRDGSGGVGIGEIYVMNPYGNAQTRLTTNVTFDFSPAWSPDSTKLAFVRFTLDNSELTYDIYVMDADGTDQTRLTTDAGGDFDPSWSPDGTTIAFA
ncbi:MAG TPA: hypothetical protein VF634_07485, partial [Pyrinomonadaceae bacterium]